MLEPIADYVRIEFSTSASAAAAERTLVTYLHSDAGIVEQALRRPRVVVWIGTDDPENRVLFLSVTAHDILRRLVPDVPSGVHVTSSALPDARQLLVGAPTDWDTGSGDRRRGRDGVL
ncbi:MAG: hypothetical protein AB7O32_00610 [Vicinamibacterales bacterium]